jgi:Glycosyl Hydrolase Family 88.
MNIRKIFRFSFLFAFVSLVPLTADAHAGVLAQQINHILNYCDEQIRSTVQTIHSDTVFPRSIGTNSKLWKTTDFGDWTSGFWPGILWLDYEATRDPYIRQKAEHVTATLERLLDPKHKTDHDIGFQLLCSFGNAYRITGDKHYRDVLLKGAERLAGLYNPHAGTILSWPHMVTKGWPHNTIMDNMMNLELLFFAAKNGASHAYYDIAVSHARKTMEHQFRPDGSNNHVALYDTQSGKFLRCLTNQGYSDNSMWARGQAWAIYGYTMVYRETGDKTFLRFAEKVTKCYLDRLPKDMIPYWDFDDPKIPDAPRDASAAAIVTSALLQLSRLEDKEQLACSYYRAAVKMLKELSTAKYQSRGKNSALLLHSVGNMPARYEVDASINYADYYYMQALLLCREEQQK